MPNGRWGSRMPSGRRWSNNVDWSGTCCHVGLWARLKLLPLLCAPRYVRTIPVYIFSAVQHGSAFIITLLRTLLFLQFTKQSDMREQVYSRIVCELCCAPDQLHAMQLPAYDAYDNIAMQCNSALLAAARSGCKATAPKCRHTDVLGSYCFAHALQRLLTTSILTSTVKGIAVEVLQLSIAA